jgi:hypothetical protein
MNFNLKIRVSGFIVSVVLLSALISGCGDEKEACVFIPETSSIDVEIVFEHFEDSLANITSKTELIEMLGREPLIRDYIFRRTEYPNDSVFVNEVYRKFTSAGIDTLLKETKRVFGDLSELKAEFTQAFTNLKYYYPDFQPPKVQTLISGMDNDLFVSDTLIIVSLDFFLGPGAKFRPKMYEYLLRQYTKDNIVPSSLMIYGISERFNKGNENDKTVIADMVAYGKAFYFAKHMLPCVPDSIFIWYTPEEINGARSNQDLIWARFIEDQVLFSTSHVTKQKYLGERPKTVEVGEKCPGRIAQWVGWQIVNSYAESHTETTLPQIMGMSDAQKLFKESRYKPQRK